MLISWPRCINSFANLSLYEANPPRKGYAGPMMTIDFDGDADDTDNGGFV